MKILFAIKSLAISGGAERVFSEISSKLSLKYDVSVLSFDAKTDESFYKINKEIKIIKTTENLQGISIKNLNPIKKIIFLRGIISSHAIDTVIGFNFSIYFLLAIGLIGLPVKVICSEHSTYEGFSKNFFSPILLSLISNLPIKFAVVSEHAFNTFPKKIQKISKIIKNPISVPFNEKLNFEDKNNTILSVGRLAEEKNHLDLLKSFKLISSKIPNWKLKIIGSGPLESQIKSFIETNDLTNRVELIKETKSIELEYQMAKFLIVPSRYEGFGLVIAEALSCGLPVVLFENGNSSNLIKNNFNGIVISNNSQQIENLSLEIEKLALNNDLIKELAKNCMKPKGHSGEKIIKDWEKLIFQDL
tara:strand:+ start:858 stop:1940 length:1083 start_codon:yes stop_codon:yes gene_type:complete